MSVLDFVEDDEPKYQRTEAEIERANRIRLAFAAAAYEFDADPILSDEEFDSLSKKIRPSMSTLEAHHTRTSTINRIKRLDEYFAEKFSPDTGMWIHDHPELTILKKKLTYLRSIEAFSSKNTG